MNYLVGDIGNTLTKLSILNHNFRIKKIFNIETKTILKGNLKGTVFDKMIKKNCQKIFYFLV